MPEPTRAQPAPTPAPASAPISRHDAPVASPGPVQRDHRRPPPPPEPAPTAGRPNTRVPIRRPVMEFQIEPTAGPVGTTVTIYGDFRRALRVGELEVAFAGARPAKPIYVSPDRMAVIVPRGARTGAVQVAMAGQQLWSGNFSVTGQDRDLFLPIQEGNGLLGAVYKLPANTQRLPDFRALGQPFATIVVPSLRVAPRRFDSGFPGISATGENLLEWFAIRFMGQITVPTTGDYGFRLNSDDGAKLYIDNKLVIDNDGVHPPQDKEGSIHLAAGKHDIVVEYFQGPRYEIALELSWRRGAGWTLVPDNAFSRYTGFDCNNQPEIMCCQSGAPECKQCQRNARARQLEWQQACGGAPGAGQPSPGANCNEAPSRMCCQSNAPQCKECRQQAAAELSAWKQQCGGAPGAGQPSPGADCNEAPSRMCCQSNAPQCKECRQQAAAELSAWKQQCGGAPGAGQPSPGANCNEAPSRMCCQSNAPQCKECRQQAAAELSAWKQQCGQAGGGTQVDCAKAPPRRACCKALTAQCKDCQRQAQAEQQLWEQQCQPTR